MPPTNDSDENTNEQFYSRLQASIEILLRRDINIVMVTLMPRLAATILALKTSWDCKDWEP
jgi:hypothetical protein